MAQDAKESFSKTEGDQVTVAAPFSQSIEATLRGAEFSIDPMGPQRRTASLMRGVQWEWTVTSKEAGTKTLAMEVVANLSLNQVSIPYQVRTLRTEIEVTISPTQQVKQFVEKVGGATIGFSAVVTSIAGLFATGRPAMRKIARLLRARRYKRALSGDDGKNPSVG